MNMTPEPKQAALMEGLAEWLRLKASKIPEDVTDYGFSRIDLNRLASEVEAATQPSGAVGAVPKAYEPLTEDRIEFGLNNQMEDPTKDEAAGFNAGARWAEAVLRGADWPIMGGRESLEDALAVVETFGEGVSGVNDTYARQIILAAEVKRLREVLAAAPLHPSQQQQTKCTYPHCDCDGPAADGGCGKAASPSVAVGEPTDAVVTKQFLNLAKELQDLQMKLHGGEFDRYRPGLCLAAAFFSAAMKEHP